MSEKSKPHMATASAEKAQRPQHRTSRLKRSIAGVALIGVAGTGVAVAHQANSRANRASRSVATQEKYIAGLQREQQQQTKEIDELATLLAGTTGVSKDVIERKGLRSTQELPGYGQEVSQADRDQMRAATVKIVERFKAKEPNGEQFPWSDNCTGLKVSVGGQIYVATARHCVTNSFDSSRVFPLKGGGDMSDMYATGTNVTSILNDQFGVQTIGIDGKTRSSVAPVAAVSITYYPDWALMKVDQHSPNATAFNKAGAIQAEKYLEPGTPGASTIVYSMPESSGGELLEGNGIYLGRVTDPSDVDRQIDLIGIDPAVPAVDACNYGASGSAAVIAGGRVTGPLTMRNNISYAPNSNAPDNLSQAVVYRLQLEQALGIDTSEYSTVCGYSVDAQNTQSILMKGFDHEPTLMPSYQPPIPDGSGMK